MKQKASTIYSNYTVLVVEDEQRTREVLAKGISRLGLNVLSAKNGKEGLELFSQHQIDIVVSDISMPEKDGLEMISDIKERHPDSTCSYIIVTAFSDEERLFQAIELGVDYFIIKPVKSRLIREKLENLIKAKVADRLMLQNMILNSKSDLLIDIAHHWRQPLNIIGLNTQLINTLHENSSLTDELLLEQTEKILGQVNALSQSIDRFRLFYQDHNHCESRFSIAEIAQNAQDILQDYQLSEGRQISFSIHGDVMVEGIPEQLQEVFITLFKNVLDFGAMRSVQDIQIQTDISESDTQTVIKVSDNVGGIDDEIIHKIFDPYFTTKFKAQDVGISLFLAKTTIEKHFNGNISAENIPEGACFTILFPVS